MSIGIIRAGPFSNGTLHNLAEPVTPTNTVLPVNCALTRSVRWPWRYLFRIGAQTRYETASSDTILIEEEAYDEGGLGVQVHWRYQSVAAQSLTVSYFIDGTYYDIDLSGKSITIWVGDTIVYSDSNNVDEPISGSPSIALPASVMPIDVRINTSVFNDFVVDTEYELMLAFNLIPTP